MKPAVSICIPAYRQPVFLARAIESVFTQDFQDFEIIVTDDSETDELLEVVAKWQSDSRFIYRRNEVRLGSPGNWNAAMALARSDLIKFLHHDDWFSSNESLGRFVQVMTEQPGVNFAFSAGNTCDFDGRPISGYGPSPEQLDRLRRQPSFLQYGNFVGSPSSTIFRKTDGFFFDEKLKWVVDIYAYLQLLGESPSFEFIPDALVSATSNAAHQITQSVAADPVLRISEHLYLYAKNPPRNIRERIDGLRFLSCVVSGCNLNILENIRTKRKYEARNIDEYIVLTAFRLKAILSSFVTASKKVI